jgi:adenylosuccinate synthase
MVALLAEKEGVDCVVKCGGSNAGHTVCKEGKVHSFRQLPSAAYLDGPILALAAGSLIDVDLLMEEIDRYEIKPGRLWIDRNAAVISQESKRDEAETGLRERISSTLSGTGAATSRKVLRDPSLRLAGDVPELRPYIASTSDLFNRLIDEGKRIVLEGTQGFGLSLHHSDHYPFVTGRDTTAGAFLSEAGLSPLLVDRIIAVFRTFPIRVSGNSGPLRGEITWDQLSEECRATWPQRELTTVTRSVRRVGRFDWDLARRSVKINRPTEIAVHGLDYLDFANRGIQDMDSLTNNAKEFLQDVFQRLDVPVTYAFTGPELVDVVRPVGAGNVPGPDPALAQ